MSADDIVWRACRLVHIDASPQLLRHGQNAIYRLRPGLIARVSRAGAIAVAHKELLVSRWLTGEGVPVVRAAEDVPSPVIVDGHAVTFWAELDITGPGTVADVAALVARIHRLPVPEHLHLADLDPFANLPQRITDTPLWTLEEREFLHQRLDRLHEHYAALPAGRQWCGVHGDAWPGNVVRTPAGPVMLDLERFAFGPPEWDLTSTAVKYATSGTVSAADWADYCRIYGHDVTGWEGFAILRDIRELRETTFAAQAAAQYPAAASQAAYRLACIQGHYGERPWGWRGFTHTNASQSGSHDASTTQKP